MLCFVSCSGIPSHKSAQHFCLFRWRVEHYLRWQTSWVQETTVHALGRWMNEILWMNGWMGNEWNEKKEWITQSLYLWHNPILILWREFLGVSSLHCDRHWGLRKEHLKFSCEIVRHNTLVYARFVSKKLMNKAKRRVSKNFLNALGWNVWLIWDEQSVLGIGRMKLHKGVANGSLYHVWINMKRLCTMHSRED